MPIIATPARQPETRPRTARPRLRRTGCALACAVLAASFLSAGEAAAQGRARGKPSLKGAAKRPPGADVQPQALFDKFPDWVACVAFAPDGKTLAAGTYNGKAGLIKLFDVHEKKEVASLTDPAGLVRSLAYTRDGKHLVAGSYQSLAAWDVEDRKRTRQFKGHRGDVLSLAFSPGDKLLASASDDESARLWSFDSGEPLTTLAGIVQPALCVAFSPDGQHLAVATGDPTRPTKRGGAYLYDAAGRLLHSLSGHERYVSAAAFSPDGTTLATGSADETIKLWNVSSGKEIKTLEGHTRPVNSLGFLAGGKWLLSVSGGRAVGGNELKLWDVTEGKDLVTVPAHEAPISQLVLSADEKNLATASYDRSVKVWDVATILAAAGQKPASMDSEIDFRPEPPALPEPASSATVTYRNVPLEPGLHGIASYLPSLPRRGAGAEESGRTASAGTEATLLAVADPDRPSSKELKLGIIGLDTSHSTAFTELLNQADKKDHVPGGRVVLAYPKGSSDIESSTKRVPEYTQIVRELGVEIVDSIDMLARQVDAVLLETNDGRPHLEQALPVLKAGKPLFIDKPIAGSLTDGVAIFEAAKRYKVPVFSCSSLRYVPGAQAIREGKIGEVKGCDAYSPCALEPTHPDLFWYGIHGVESLFTVMGTGCETVSRTSTPGIDVAVGTWNAGRVGTFRGIRSDAGGGAGGYGGTAFGTKGVEQLGTYAGYRPLVVEIIKFFETGKSPVAEEETLEIYAFMEAADESKRQGGKPVSLASVLAKAREGAVKRLADLGVPPAK